MLQKPETTEFGTVVEAEAILGAAKLVGYHFIMAAVIAALMFVDGYNLAVAGYIAPPMSEALGIPRPELGPVFSASPIGNLVGLLFLGPVIRKVGPRAVIIGSVLLFGAAETGAALSGSLPGLVIFRFIAGLGISTAMVSGITLLGEFFPERWRSSAVTYVFLGLTVGQMSAGWASSVLLKMGFGWQGPLLFGTSISFAIGFLLMWMLPNSPEYLINRKKAPGEAARIVARIAPGAVPQGAELIASRKEAKKGAVRDLFVGGMAIPTLSLWLASLMNFLVSSFMSGWLTTVLVDSGIELHTAISISVTASAGGLAAGLAVGPLMDKLHPLAVASGLMLLGALSAFFLAVATPHSIIYLLTAGAFVLTFCNSGMSKGIYALGIYLYPTAARPPGVAWAAGVGRFGLIFGPLIAGWLIHLGWAPAQIWQAVGAPFLVASVALFFGFRRMIAIKAQASG